MRALIEEIIEDADEDADWHVEMAGDCDGGRGLPGGMMLLPRTMLM